MTDVDMKWFDTAIRDPQITMFVVEVAPITCDDRKIHDLKALRALNSQGSHD